MNAHQSRSKQVYRRVTPSNSRPKVKVAAQPAPPKVPLGNPSYLSTQYPRSTRIPEKDPLSNHPLCSRICQLLDIDESDSVNVQVFDEQDGLMLLYCPDPEPHLAHVKGIVVDTTDVSIVCSSFGHTREYVVGSQEIPSLDEGDDATFTVAYEGTILRLYWVEALQEWKVSTFKRIDASKSRWSGRPFLESFDQVWDSNWYSLLNKQACYTLLMSDPESRIVCVIPELSLYHVGTFIPSRPGINVLYSAGKVDKEWAILHQGEPVLVPEILSVTSCQEAAVMLERENTEYTKKATGVLVTCGSGRLLKLVPAAYARLREIRGNEPSFWKRLIYLWRGDTHKRITNLLKLIRQAGIGTLPEPVLSKPQNTEVVVDASTDLAKTGLSPWMHENLVQWFPEHENLAQWKVALDTDIPEALADFYNQRYILGQRVYLLPPVYTVLEAVKRGYNDGLSVEENIRFRMSTIPLSHMYDLLEEWDLKL